MGDTPQQDTSRWWLRLACEGLAAHLEVRADDNPAAQFVAEKLRELAPTLQFRDGGGLFLVSMVPEAVSNQLQVLPEYIWPDKGDATHRYVCIPVKMIELKPRDTHQTVWDVVTK